MLPLPTGVPLFENLAATRLVLPDIIGKLCGSGITGYATFVFRPAVTYLMFRGGQLTHVQHEQEDGLRLQGSEAVQRLAELMTSSVGGAFNTYMLGDDLTIGITCLLGNRSGDQQNEVAGEKLNALTGDITANRTTGCLRVTSGKDSALAFFNDGSATGYFLSGQDDVVASAAGFQQMAQQPGATLQLFEHIGQDQKSAESPLTSGTIRQIWERVVADRQAAQQTQVQQREKQELELQLKEREQLIRKIVTEHVGTVGDGVIDKGVGENGGSCLTAEGVNRLLHEIELASRVLANSSSIQRMKERVLQVITSSAAPAA